MSGLLSRGGGALPLPAAGAPQPVHGPAELPVYQYVHSLVNASRAGVTVTIRRGSGLLRVTDDCPKCWVGILVCKFEIASLSILKLL